ncbi:MAG: four helix bundle protein [bacterium]
MLNLNHKRLEVWKESLDLIKYIYTITTNFPKSELFGLTSQLRRAAVSIASNIAEGCSRKSVHERKRFFEISRSSLVEIDTQLEISFNLKYLTVEDFKNLNEPVNKLFAKLSNLILKTN